MIKTTTHNTNLSKIKKIEKNNNSYLTSVNERINQLLDKDSYWLELSKIAGYSLYKENLPSANIICGIGIINNIKVMIIANNPEVKAGCYFPITIKKHLRAQEIAMDLKLPCVYLVESAGLYLPKQAQVFADHDGFGKIFYNQALLKQANIHQIAIIFGTCVAGGAYIPAMADEIIMIQQQASMFLAGPALVKAAIGEVVNAENLGGAHTHCYKSGVADYLAINSIEAINLCRKLVANNSPKKSPAISKAQITNKPNTKIYDIIPKDNTTSIDIHLLINYLIDNNDFQEFKANYANTIIAGFAKINNIRVAILANNGILLANSAQKAKQFIEVANKKATPLIFIQNINGFMVGKQAEQSAIIKRGAELIQAISCSQLKKITLMINNSYGAGNYAMCGRAFKPSFLWSWPNATTAVMGSAQALQVLSDLKSPVANSPESFITNFEHQSSILYTSANLWDDGVIDPASTKEILTHSLLAITENLT